VDPKTEATSASSTPSLDGSAVSASTAAASAGSAPSVAAVAGAAPSVAGAARVSPSLATTAAGLLRLFVQGCLLLMAGLLTVVAFVWLVPEVNDYHLASGVKHKRLATLKSPKIVLAGGSNLAFGIDSPMIEKATGMPVVNMGMDGYLGVEFLLAEIERDVQPSDLVVVAPEHDSYIIPPEGVAESQLAIVKANPGAFEYLTTEQRRALPKSVILVAQAKIKRLITDTAQTLQAKLLGETSAWQMAEHIGRFEGFNQQGDFTSHLDVRFPLPPAFGLDLASKPHTPITRRLLDFSRRMRAKNVRVLFSYPPLAEPYYAKYRSSVDAIHTALVADPEANAPTPPSAFVYPEAWFFDTVYHVTRRGREARTRLLLQDIQRTLAGPTAQRLAGDEAINR
jgi:hypothetical protein